MAANVCGPEVTDGRGSEKKLDVAGWGLFLVWVGMAIITDIGWGTGLTGVGFIILLGQAARSYLGVKTEKFPILLGVFFVLGGIWELTTIQLSLAPIVCVVAGLALLVSAVVRKSQG